MTTFALEPMTVFALIYGSLALAAGLGLLIVALLHLESKEREGYVSKGWRYEHGKDQWQSK